MQDGEPQVYTALTALHVGYSTRQWQRLQLLFLFNSVAVPAMLAGNLGDIVRLFLSTIALFGHGGLMVAVDKTNERITHIEKKLTELEMLDAEGSSKCRVAIFSEESSPLRRASVGFLAPFLTFLLGWAVFTCYLALTMLKLK